MNAPLRKSVPLSEDTARDLALIRTRGTDQARAAADLIGADPAGMSEAQTLAAVIDLGRRLIEERVREESYRRLAAIDVADAQRARERAALRARREEREARRATEEESES